MPFSDPFNNVPPASVTPSRGAAFDNTVPAQSYATAQTFESSANASWSPTNATPQTVNGIILPSPAQFDFLDELAPGMPFGSGTIYSVVINSETVYPLLIATSGSYSIYATNAGVQYFYDPSTGNQRVEIKGSVKITNPNGYDAIGAFRHSIPSQGSLSGALTAPWFMLNFEIYLSSTRLTAQPSNTATTRRDLRSAVGSAFNNDRAQFKYDSSAVFSVPLAACSVVPSDALTTIFLPNLQGSINGSPRKVTGFNFTAAASGGMTRTGIFNDFPTALAISFNTNVEGDKPRFKVCELAGSPIYLEGKGRWSKITYSGFFGMDESWTSAFAGPCFFHHPQLGVLQGVGEVESTYTGNVISYTLTGVTMRFFINNSGLSSSFTNTAQ
jgi:hypothetical protein